MPTAPEAQAACGGWEVGGVLRLRLGRFRVARECRAGGGWAGGYSAPYCARSLAGADGQMLHARSGRGEREGAFASAMPSGAPATTPPAGHARMVRDVPHSIILVPLDVQHRIPGDGHAVSAYAAMVRSCVRIVATRLARDCAPLCALCRALVSSTVVDDLWLVCCVTCDVRTQRATCVSRVHVGLCNGGALKKTDALAPALALALYFGLALVLAPPRGHGRASLCAGRGRGAHVCFGVLASACARSAQPQPRCSSAACLRLCEECSM